MLSGRFFLHYNIFPPHKITVFVGFYVMVGSSATLDDGDAIVARSKIGLNSSTPSRWWRAKTDNNRSSSLDLINSELRHYQLQMHQRQRQSQRVKSQEENRKLWLMWNGAQEKLNDENDEKLINGEETGANSTRKETEESLSLLENLVHPEEELLDEINDRQIIQAVIASMAQWNLRKLQKMQRKSSDQTRYCIQFMYYSIRFNCNNYLNKQTGIAVVATRRWSATTNWVVSATKVRLTTWTCCQLLRKKSTRVSSSTLRATVTFPTLWSTTTPAQS